MSAPRLVRNTRWFASFSFNMGDDEAASVSATMLSRGVGSWIETSGGTLVRPPDDRPNPRTLKIDGAWRRMIVTTEVGFELSADVEGARLNRAVAESLRSAASNASWVDVDRVSAALATCSSAESEVRRAASFIPLVAVVTNSPIARVCADYSALRGWPTTGVTSALGSTAASAVTGRVSDSDHIEAIGTVPPALNGSVFDDLGRWWQSVPTWAKVTGGVIGVTGVVGVGAYAYRSVK